MARLQGVGRFFPPAKAAVTPTEIKPVRRARVRGVTEKSENR